MADDNAARERRARLQTLGRQAFLLEEMLTLGFWPPPGDAAQKRDLALAELQHYGAELKDLQYQLATVETQIAAATDVAAQIAEIRKRRIERVRVAREERRKENARRQEEHHAADQQRRREQPPFLGHGVSGGLRFEGGDPQRLAALHLPNLTTATAVAEAIGIAPEALAFLTYHRGAATIDHYNRFTIPKRGGGTRMISSPKSRLRVAQRWVLRTLLSHIELHSAAMAFRPQRTIVHNARLHRHRAVVIRLDLKDFFPSIGFRRVKGLFESFGYNEGVATILALLTTEAPRVAVTLDGQRRFVAIGERQLPQGACTSPALTNILCRTMDRRLAALAGRFGFMYTRYADDMVFSHQDAGAAVGPFLTMVRRVVNGENFVIKEEKTRVMRPQHRQTVTGLVVNAEPGLSRVDLRRYRAFLHHCETEGLAVMSERLGKNAHAYASGYLAFIHMVSPARAELLERAHPWLVPHKTGISDPSEVITTSNGEA